MCLGVTHSHRRVRLEVSTNADPALREADTCGGSAMVRNDKRLRLQKPLEKVSRCEIRGNADGKQGMHIQCSISEWASRSTSTYTAYFNLPTFDGSTRFKFPSVLAHPARYGIPLDDRHIGTNDSLDRRQPQKKTRVKGKWGAWRSGMRRWDERTGLAASWAAFARLIVACSLCFRRG